MPATIVPRLTKAPGERVKRLTAVSSSKARLNRLRCLHGSPDSKTTPSLMIWVLPSSGLEKTTNEEVSERPRITLATGLTSSSDREYLIEFQLILYTEHCSANQAESNPFLTMTHSRLIKEPSSSVPKQLTDT